MKTKRWFDETTQLRAHSTPHRGVSARREKIVLFGLAVTLALGTASLTELQAQQTKPKTLSSQQNAKSLPTDSASSDVTRDESSLPKQILLLPVWLVRNVVSALFHRTANKSPVSISDPPNPDQSYPRKQVLRKFAEALNHSIPEYRSLEKKGFYIDSAEKPRGFFIYDLSDTSNKETSLRESIKLLDGHIYHFAPIYYPYSFSHIAILKDGQMTVFRSINCKDRGDSIADVMRYVEQHRKDDQHTPEILERLKDFRKYGVYIRIDSFATLQCKENKVP